MKSVLILSLLFLLLITSSLYSQETRNKRTSIITGIGIAINEGQREMGIGLLYSIGWQKSYGKKQRIQLNPILLLGGFTTALPIPTDTRDQFYKISSLGLNVHYDLLKSSSSSIVVTGGGFINYSRGLMGTGGWQQSYNNTSDFFYAVYFAANVSLGIRIKSAKAKRNYELRPINVQFGNNGFLLWHFMFVIDFKLAEKN